jgi:hypothetical protein
MKKKIFVAFRIIPFLYPGSAYPHHTCIPSYQIKLFHSFRPVILHDSIPTFIPFWCMCNDLIFDKKMVYLFYRGWLHRGPYWLNFGFYCIVSNQARLPVWQAKTLEGHHFGYLR